MSNDVIYLYTDGVTEDEKKKNREGIYFFSVLFLFGYWATAHSENAARLN